MNGEQINSELEFTEHIERMEDRELSEYTALLVFRFAGRLARVERKVNKKRTALLGTGGGAGIIALIIYLIQLFSQ